MIKDARAGTTGSIPAFYDVIIMKEDRSDGMVNIKIVLLPKNAMPN